MAITRIRPYQDVIDKIYRSEIPEGQLTHNVTFQVTDACNLACTYCYQTNKHNNVMPFEIAKEFIELLLEKGNPNTASYIDSWNSKAVAVEFIGGEPFLQIDLIDKVSDYFVQRCIELDHPWQYHHMFSICSNGVLYFEPKVQEYIRKHKNNLSFSISIDGNKELHDACRIFPDGRGSYDIAMAGVRHYIDVLGGSMGSKMTIAPGNVMYVANAVKSLIENGYKDINLNCVYEEGWTEEHAKILYQQLKELSDFIIDNDLFDKIRLSIFEDRFFQPKRENDTQTWCGGNGKMIAVDYKGDIYPCLRYMESSVGDDVEPFIIGNTKEGLLSKPYWCERCQLLKDTTRISESTQECLDCPIADGCSDCLAYNYQLYGLPIKRATFICIMHKARSLANAYFWNKGYKSIGSNKRFKIWLPDEEALKIIDEEELKMLHTMEITL